MISGVLVRLGARLFRAALRTFPRSLRERYGAEPVALFEQRVRDVAARRGLLAAAATILVNVADTTFSGLRARMEIRHRRRGSVSSPVADSVKLVVSTLLRRPRFLALVGIPMTLALGATTAAISIADIVALRPLPIPNAERVLLLGERSPKTGRVEGISVANFVDLREAVTQASSLHLVTAGSFPVDLPDGPERMPTFRVSEGTLDLIGAEVALGRGFVPRDFVDQTAALLGFSLWQSRFGGDPGVLGRVVRVNGEPREIVGVMADDTRMPRALAPGRIDGKADLWLPLDTSWPTYQAMRPYGFEHAAAVLPPSGSVEALREELRAIGNALVEAYPEANSGSDGVPKTWDVVSLRDATSREARPRLLLLVSTTLLLLAIAVVNSANLVLLNAAERGREIALRMSLGASRLRVGAELVLEAVLVCAAAGVGGLVLASLALDVLAAFGPEDIPRLHEAGFDLRVLAIGVLLIGSSGGLAGLVPASLVARSPLGSRLSSARSTTGRFQTRLRHGFVAAQAAVALTLAVNAGLLVSTLTNLLTIDRGFDPHDLWAVRVSLNQVLGEGEPSAPVFREIRDRVAEIPGVTSASASVFLLGDTRPVGVETFIRGENVGRRSAHNVLSDFFATMRIPIVEGRAFTADDHRSDAARAVILSQAMARDLFPGGDAVGSEVGIGDPTLEGDAPWTVVGVAADTRSGYRAESPEPVMYLPYESWDWLGSMMILARTTPGLGLGMERAFREAIRSADPRIPRLTPFRLTDFLSDSAAETRFYAGLLSAFSAIAILLAAVGLYATLSFSVSRRRRELAIRIALGASPLGVVPALVRGAVVATVAGCAVGLALSRLSEGLLEGMLFGLAPGDPRVLAGTTTLLVAVAIVAAWRPGRRAARADPIEALRAE